jgi:non-ribosomal peptide synthetase component F
MAGNILPIRIAVNGTTTVASLTRQVATVIVNSSRHQRYHYVQIRRDLRLVNDAFFGMVVNIMPFDYELSFGDCSVRAHNLANGPVDDITVSVYDRSSGGIEISYDVNPDLYDAGAEQNIAPSAAQRYELADSGFPRRPGRPGGDRGRRRAGADPARVE